jgi:hypothetical protein
MSLVPWRFRDFDWIGNKDGYYRPSDVLIGNILMGVITSKPQGYVIEMIVDAKDQNHQMIKKDEKNWFETKDKAAEMVYMTWNQWRKAKS